jgi:protein tyrosine phosphatase (PTP) superfamily phosphohydrolase (DUF442 family)
MHRFVSRLQKAAWLLAALLIITPAAVAAESAVPARPAACAAPLQLEGVPNLHRIDAGLYRSAQPSEAGFSELKKLGIKTVLSLRAFHSDADYCRESGMAHCYRIPILTWDLERAEIVRFLKYATDPTLRPLLVHCQHGADRTGTMSAVYRMVVQGWSREAAIREMVEGGYGYHPMWEELLDTLRKLDVAALRREAGIKAPATEKQ